MYPTEYGGVVIIVTRHYYFIDAITCSVFTDEGYLTDHRWLFPFFVSPLFLLTQFLAAYLFHRPVGRIQYTSSRSPKNVQYKSSSSFVPSEKAFSSVKGSFLKPQLYRSPNPYHDDLDKGWYVLVRKIKKNGGGM